MRIGRGIGAAWLLVASAASAVCADAACADTSAGSTPASASAASPGGATQAGADGGLPSGPLRVVVPGPQEVDEEHALEVALHAEGGRGGARIFVEGLPPGAEWDEATGKLRFVPDFTQGGLTARVKVTAIDADARASAAFDIHVVDTITPPAPVVTKTEPMNGFVRLTVTQTTDAFLDSPGHAGRTFTAMVLAPTGTSALLPVRVGLHGFDSVPDNAGWSGEFRIFPADPENTYWWGYGAELPAGAPTKDAVPGYTARRVLHLLAWVLTTYAAADPERAYLDGVSMGGAGAMTIGLLHARHFCHVRAGYGQAIPKNHRPSRIAQLSGLWGAPELALEDGDGMPAWDRMDLTRVVRDVPEARDQFLSLHHAKDDATIHFGAVVMPSALTGATFYAALQAQHIGHHAVWDEGGHVVPDPVLGDNWWTSGWDPVFDGTALLVRNRAFAAFSGASFDRNPGTGSGNGKQPWNAESGYAGNVSVPGDTGWDGDIAGGLNRFLRWDGTKVVDTIDRFEIPLRVVDGAGAPPPKPGYPTTGDKLDGTVPVVVSVTPRRVQSFRCRAGERIMWQAGDRTGTATADATGAVTIPGLSLGTAWTTLSLSRAP